MGKSLVVVAVASLSVGCGAPESRGDANERSSSASAVSASASAPPAPSAEPPTTSPSASAEPIGEATMNADGSIVLDLHRPAHARVTYAPSDPKYKSILDHVGPLEPGKSKPVMPWPDDIDDARVAKAVADYVQAKKGWQPGEWKHEITGTDADGNVVVAVTFKKDPVAPGGGKSFQLKLAPRDYGVVGEVHFQ